MHRIANSPRYLVFTAAGILVVASVAYAIFEHKQLDDAVWWAMVTASTVGYGDAYPTSTPGRAIAVCLAMSMVFILVPLITASVASKLIVNRDAFTHEEQEELKMLLRATLEKTQEIDREIDEGVR